MRRDFGGRLARLPNRFEIQGGEPLSELLNRLVAPDPRFTSVAKLADRQVLLATLAALGETRDERATPYLVMPLVADDAAVAAAAAKVLERVMPRDLPGIALLEQKVRDLSWHGYERWWPDGRPPIQLYAEESSARLALQRGLPTAALGLLSMNANGHTRELATRALASATAAGELPFLLLRVNDWVSEVSAVARGATEQRILPENAATFVALLPLVERLKSQRRVDVNTLAWR